MPLGSLKEGGIKGLGLSGCVLEFISAHVWAAGLHGPQPTDPRCQSSSAGSAAGVCAGFCSRPGPSASWHPAAREWEPALVAIVSSSSGRRF